MHEMIKESVLEEFKKFYDEYQIELQSLLLIISTLGNLEEILNDYFS